jgi:hypothetical protein
MIRHTRAAIPFQRAEVAQLIARAILICLLVVPLTLNLPRVIHFAHAAAPLEDCDADGFDDATGVAVPWPGYDETHGDTPAGPGTADWWIKQNAAPTGGTNGSPSSDGSPSGSDNTPATGGTSQGSSSGGSKGTSTSNSSSKAGTAAGGSAATKTQAPAPAAATAKPAAVPTTVAVAPVSTVASAPSSAVGSASAESSNAALAGGIANGGGPSGGNASLWEALSVGFTGDNSELLAGLGLLAALALAGALSLGAGALRGLGSRSRLRQGDLERAEEPVASTA